MRSTQRIFYNACYKGYLNIVKLCIECGADIHNDRNWALRYSIINNRYEAVKYLLENGANPYDKNSYGWDSFDEARYYRATEMVEILKQYKYVRR